MNPAATMIEPRRSAASSGRLSLTTPTSNAAQGVRRSVEQKMLNALLSELEVTCMFVAVSASLANAILDEELAGKICREALVSYLPPDAPLFAASAIELLHLDIEVDVLLALQMFYARLTLAKRISLAYVAESSVGGPSRSICKDTMADAWQRTCQSGFNAAQVLRQAMSESGEQASRSRMMRLGDLLRAAQRSEHPCVEPDGSITIPGWAERRRTRRQKREQDCKVFYEDQVLLVRLQDLSCGGLGVAGQPSPPRGSAVTLELGSGRTLTGSVAWSAGDRWGVRLDTHLAPDDPLLADRNP